MSFLDHFKGKTQKIPKEGYLNLFGLQQNQASLTKKTNSLKLNQSLQKITSEEKKLQQEILELNEYQLKRYSKISTEIATPRTIRSISSKQNFSAIRSAKIILQIQ